MQYEPICLYCTRFIEAGKVLRCSAYPNGIPTAIEQGKDMHLMPRHDDNGLQFEPDPEYLEILQELVDEGDYPEDVLTAGPEQA